MMLLSAFALLGTAALAGWLAPRVPWAAVLSWLLCLTAAVVLLVTGARALHGHNTALALGDLGTLGAARLQTDELSGLFLVIAFAVCVPALLAAITTTSTPRPRLPAAIALCLAAVQIVLTADNLFVLLFGWEGLTVAFYLLSGFDRARPGRARSSVVTIAFGKASGACLLAGGLVLAAHAGTFDLSGLAAGASGSTRQIGYALLLLGFAVKVGLVPVQIWLPPGYACAPPAARAVMAGVSVNVGFYGMWRVLQLLGPPPVWLIVVVLLLAGCTAILGIAHAAVHADLAYLVAWSSVENAGVITAGYGVAMVGARAHLPQLTAAGLLAATAQVCTHALGKTLLYVATAAIEHDTASTGLDALRGIARRLPWAGTGLVVGSLTLAGLPLTAGFASEWLTLEALMQQFRVDDLAVQLATAVAGALVALSVGVAGVTFVRLVGLCALGGTTTVVHAGADRELGHRAAVILLVAGCLGAAMLAPLEVRMIAGGLAPLVGPAAHGGLKSPWVLQPVYGQFSALSPSWLWLALPALIAILAIIAVLLSGRRLFRVRRVPAWSSGSPGVERGVGYTSFGYANPMRKVLANLLMTRGELRREELRTGGQVGAEGSGAAGIRLGYTVDVLEVVQHYLYRPAAISVLALARFAKRLQSGRLDAYLTYMLIALVAVLALVAATA